MEKYGKVIMLVVLILYKNLFIGSGLGLSVSFIVVVFVVLNGYFDCFFDEDMFLYMMGELEG